MRGKKKEGGKLLVIVGESGAGKTRLEELLERDHKFTHLKTPTNKKRVRDAHQYEVLSEEKFEILNQSGGFLWVVEVKGRRYGMSKSGIEQALREEGRRTSIAITPDCLEMLHAFHEEVGCGEIIYIFLQTSQNVRLERMVRRGDDPGEAQKRIDKEADWPDIIQEFNKTRGGVHFIDNNRRFEEIERRVTSILHLFYVF